MTTQADERGPREIDERFFTSLLEADTKALDPLLTDDFLLVDVMRGGEVTRAVLIAALGERRLRFEGIDVLESRVRRYGSAAIVTGVTRMHGHMGDIGWEATSRYTHVMVEQNGRWRLASAQGTSVIGA